MAMEQILKASLGAAEFERSRPFIIPASQVVLDFQAVVGAGAAGIVQWYFEFHDSGPVDNDASWFREVIEQAPLNGNIAMPEVVRTLQANGGGNLTAGTTFRMSYYTTRFQGLARIRARATQGSVTLTVTANGTIGRA